MMGRTDMTAMIMMTVTDTTVERGGGARDRAFRRKPDQRRIVCFAWLLGAF